ncbi:MAG: flagellar biosynthesis protein FlhF [Planctomycetaceae bacterium]
MTDVRTFKADSMQEALELVRQEMGAEAVILHTRHVTPRRLLPWRKVRPEVEVTAGLGINVRPAPARRRSQRASARPQIAAEPIAPRDADIAGDHETTRAVTPTLSDYLKNRDFDQPADTSLEELAKMADRLDSVSLSDEAVSVEARVPQPTEPAQSVPQNRDGSPLGRSSTEFAAKLDSIHRMLESLGRTGHIGREREIPSELFALYTELIDAETEDDLARDLIFRLKQHCSDEQLQDASAARMLLTGMVEAEIRCCDPIVPRAGRRKVVALVGATGVGKTTTIAKLAANYRLRQGIRMGLVTVDTYRIAAVEQLRTYAEIIDLPMKVVTNPLEMGRALDELIGLDLVLIDTAGRSPRDDLQIQELKRLLAEANVDEVHLVLNMTASVRSLEATTQKFSAASKNMTSIMLTKLDEAAGMGTLLSIARRIPLPISYLTTGQDVPDDIEPATPGRIARLVLGQDKILN